ncbi:MAG: hypothetical protein ACRDQ7_11060 [Haloechinothrix sp.]
MAQLSFLSAEARVPAVADLAGLLCGRGQAASFAATAARISVVVDDLWRARLLAAEFARRGIDAGLARTDSGHPSVRTPFRTDLIRLANAWTRGAVKTVPADFHLDGAALKFWLLACGRKSDRDYLLMLDPRAPDTHEPLLRALHGIGLVPAVSGGNLVGARGGTPAARIAGRRRLDRLAELVGEPPLGAESEWPTSHSPMPAA